MKVTQKDIASALNLSRNTVGKALRNDGLVSKKTVERVQEYARKMNYTKFVEQLNYKDDKKIISVLAHQSTANGNSFWMQVLSGIEQTVSVQGYHVSICFVNSVSQVVPDSMIAGYIMIGMFNTDDYYKIIEMIGDTPIVFVDIASRIPLNALERDIVLMENVESVREVTQYIIENGHRNIGFIGNISARSNYDRYRGYRKAMQDNGLKILNKYCLLNFENKYSARTDGSLWNWVHSLSEFPTAFVCANDSIALYLIDWFRNDFNLRIPEDISLSGFDNVEESKMLKPYLTTVQCYKKELGKRAAEEILWRMDQGASRPYEIIRVGTKVIYRDTIYDRNEGSAIPITAEKEKHNKKYSIY